MASAVDGAGGRALEAVAAAAVEDQMVRSPAASSNLPMAPAASAGLAGEGVGAAVAAEVAEGADQVREELLRLPPDQVRPEDPIDRSEHQHRRRPRPPRAGLHDRHPHQEQLRGNDEHRYREKFYAREPP